MDDICITITISYMVIIEIFLYIIHEKYFINNEFHLIYINYYFVDHNTYVVEKLEMQIYLRKLFNALSLDNAY